MAKWKS